MYIDQKRELKRYDFIQIIYDVITFLQSTFLYYYYHRYFIKKKMTFLREEMDDGGRISRSSVLRRQGYAENRWHRRPWVGSAEAEKWKRSWQRSGGTDSTPHYAITAADRSTSFPNEHGSVKDNKGGFTDPPEPSYPITIPTRVITDHSLSWWLPELMP